MSTRGTWRAVHTALLDDPDFQALSSSARLTLLACRLGSQNTMPSIFRFYRQVLEDQTGLKAHELDAALEELASRPSRARPWVIHDGQVLWVRNGLRFDPTVTLENDNHRTAILRVLASLPSKSVVVRKFKVYYKLASGSPRPSRAVSHPQGHTPSPTRSTSSTPSSTPNPNPIPNQSTSTRGGVGGTNALDVGNPLGGKPPSPPVVAVSDSKPSESNSNGHSASTGNSQHHDKSPVINGWLALLAEIQAQHPDWTREQVKEAGIAEANRRPAESSR